MSNNIIENKTNQNTTFEYNYSAKRQAEIEAIQKKYLPQEDDKLEQLRALDRSVERSGTIASIIVGLVGALVFGTGMSLTLVWTDSLLISGIIVGVIGIALMGAAYPLYQRMTKREKKRLAPQILALSEELLK